MPDKLTEYRRAGAPLPEKNCLWPLYGAGLENLGDDGQPIEGATVCLSKSDAYAVGTTNAGGLATIDFLPPSEGTFQITATLNSYVPAMDSATVAPATTAALRVNDWVQKDAAEFLGISSRVMNYKVSKYEIKNPRWSKNKAAM